MDLLPMYLKHKLDPTSNRTEIAGYFVNKFNFHLGKNVNKFRATNPDTKASLISTSDIFWEAYMNPRALDAENNTCHNKTNTKCVRRPLRTHICSKSSNECTVMVGSIPPRHANT
jgi:hypothetical protein